MIKRIQIQKIPNWYYVSAAAFILIGCMSVWSAKVIAQTSEYPDTYTTTTEASAPDQPAPPKIDFDPSPSACAPDDQICINSYLETFQQNLQGSVLSSVPPSPAYTRRIYDAQQCALNDQALCNALEEEWQNSWIEQASKRELDLQAPQGEEITCKQAYDYWGLKYYYMCQKQ
jgi:hypothetical protein